MTTYDAPPLLDALEVSPDCPLVLVDHVPDVLGEAHGFGGFLFDPHGKPVIEHGKAWLYTTRLENGAWDSWARQFNLATMQHGPARRVLAPGPGRDRAVLHHVLAFADDLIVGLYCDGVGVRGATATLPDADFIRDSSFAIRPEPGWETRGENTAGWSLECNGAHSLCEDTAGSAVFWQSYDSYRRDGRLGDLGWVRIRLDKATRRLSALERHPENPLPFRRPEWACVRCGGNLSSDVIVSGKRAFFYYIRPDAARLFIGMCLSTDPLCFRDTQHYVIGGVLGDEEVAEKFQAIQHDRELLLFYESRHKDGTWRTGLRRYRFR